MKQLDGLFPLFFGFRLGPRFLVLPRRFGLCSAEGIQLLLESLWGYGWSNATTISNPSITLHIRYPSWVSCSGNGLLSQGTDNCNM